MFASRRLIRIVAAADVIGPSQAAPRDLAGRALTAIRRRLAATGNVIHQPHGPGAIAGIDMIPRARIDPSNCQWLYDDGNRQWRHNRNTFHDRLPRAMRAIASIGL